MAADWAFPAIGGPGPGGAPGPATGSQAGFGPLPAASRTATWSRFGGSRAGLALPPPCSASPLRGPSAVPALVLHCSLN